MSDADDYPEDFKRESEEWDRDRESGYYQKSLYESKQNPLSQHGDGPLNKVLDPEEMPWEESPQGKLKHVLNEDITEGLDFPAKGVNMYIQEIPPGSKSGKHRHMSEELVFVLEGEGYDHHWDAKLTVTGEKDREEPEWAYDDEPTKYEWEAGDLVVIHGGCSHQHLSADPANPCRVLIINPRPLYRCMHLLFEGRVIAPPAEPAKDPEWTPP
jgi:uncharacterized RmlC-like cupin family protein